MCCGSHRAAARAAAMAPGPRQRPAPSGPPDLQESAIVFEYVGSGPAAIRGPVSGRMYRFERAGDRVRVDARDRPGLAASPLVRWIR